MSNQKRNPIWSDGENEPIGELLARVKPGDTVKRISKSPESHAVIRLPPTTMDRKRAYLKAANGQPLAEWMFEQCDKAAGFKRDVLESRRKAPKK